MEQESNEILIDSYRSGAIDKIAKDNTTIFTDFGDFVNEAIGTYIMFWTDPAQAQVNFNNLLPHMRPEQLEFIKKMMDKADPTGKEYENFTKGMNEAKSKLQPQNYFPLKNPGQQRFHLDDIRFRAIEKIIQTENVSKKLKSVKAFVDYAITLFMTWWTEPEEAMPLQYAIWSYMPTKVKEEWKNNSEFEKTFIQFDKDAKKWNEKQGIVLPKFEDSTNLENINNEIQKKTQSQEFLVPDERETIKTVTTEGAKNLYKICNNIEETRQSIKTFVVPKHRTGDALPYDDFPLIWEFYSRILPIKLLVTVLADMMVKKGTPLVSYSDFREKGYYAALGLSDNLSDYEKKYGIKRNEKRSTGFPISPIHILTKKEIEKEKKFTASKERFQEHFIGMKKEPWVKRQYENDSEEKRNRKTRKGLGYFDGALNAMGLVHVHAELYGHLTPEWQESKNEFVYTDPTIETDTDPTIETDKNPKKNPASKHWDLKIGLTKRGVDFFSLENPILRDFPEWSENNIFSKEESDFIIKNIMPDFPLENELIKKAIDTISKSSKNSVSGKDIDEKFSTIITQWLLANEDHFSFAEINKFRDKTIGKIDLKPKGTKLAEAWRARTMARLTELNQIEWNMEPKTGKPIYSLKKKADLISQ